MRNKKILLLLLMTNIILIGIILNLITRNTIIPKEKHILKEMTETEYDNSINSLNKSHTDYSNYIQTCKSNLATAITTAGVTTDSNASFETITTNISQILSTKTNDATATANDILSGKTAYIKGSKITGTMASPPKIYNLGKATSYNIKTLTGLDDTTLSKLTENNFIVEILSISSASTSDGSCRRKY